MLEPELITYHAEVAARNYPCMQALVYDAPGVGFEELMAKTVPAEPANIPAPDNMPRRGCGRQGCSYAATVLLGNTGTVNSAYDETNVPGSACARSETSAE